MQTALEVKMDVSIVSFPETPLAVAEHYGSPETLHKTQERLSVWQRSNGVNDGTAHQSFRIHYQNSQKTPCGHPLDVAVSTTADITENPFGIVKKVIPASRCAVSRIHGDETSIEDACAQLHAWLKDSGEAPGPFPVFLKTVTDKAGTPSDNMTDIYLPLRDSDQ